MLFITRRFVRNFFLYVAYALVIAAMLSSAKENSEGPSPTDAPLSGAERRVAAERRRQTKRVYSLLDHGLRVCVFTFLSAVFAGLTLGVMCADTFTLEIIAESGPKPDCKYAATVLPLRKQGHQTLCTLIITNMLCNVLIVQELSDVFDVIHAIRTSGNAYNVVDDSGSSLWNFILSTTVIVIFTELIPMSVCKSKYSLKVAAAGSTFVRIASVLTYLVSYPLGKFLDWLVGTEEAGQIYDRSELRRLMVVHYERVEGNDKMAKSELDLLLAAMDFHERCVKDIMTPIEDVVYVRETDKITPDFVEQLWLSGRSRVPVQSRNGQFLDVLVVKDLFTINANREFEPFTVAQVVRSKNRVFAMVGEHTTMPSMLKLFQDAKTHMAVVFADDPIGTLEKPAPGTAVRSQSPDGARRAAVPKNRSFAVEHNRTVGIVTLEDVVEELLNGEIYDEYDRYAPAEVTGVPHPKRQLPERSKMPDVPEEPQELPRVNFFSYFTHPEEDIPLSEAQVWMAAYFLNRAVPCFVSWSPGCIKMLLDECKDEQLVPTPKSEQHKKTPSTETSLSGPSTSSGGSLSTKEHGSLPRPLQRKDHTSFLSEAQGEKYVLYANGVPSEYFTLVLGGTVDLMVGEENFRTSLRSFEFIGEEALTKSFFVPDYSAVVRTAARVYRISKDKYERILSYEASLKEHHSRVYIVKSKSGGNASTSPPLSPLWSTRSSNVYDASERQRLLPPSAKASAARGNKLYGTMKRNE